MIVLSAGHFPGAPGASYGLLTEHGEASQWVRLIAEELQHHDTVAVVPTGPLLSKIKWINARTPEPVLAAELHFNSDVSKRQSGCETLYCPGSEKGRRAAEYAQFAMAPLFPPSRGVKEGWYLMDKPGVKEWSGDVEGDEVIDAFLRLTRCTAIILEPEFIYNESILASKREQACVVIARALAAAAQELQL